MEAIPALEVTLATSTGRRPATATLVSGATRDRLRAGRSGRKAIPLLERTLTDRERLLGPNHPHTLISRNNLAAVRLTKSEETARER